MTIPKVLRDALAQADDGYLIGLSNKGTVNRARKDLASLRPEAAGAGEEVTVRLGDVTAVIRSPLGSSACSCPSSGMCRHRIAAILWLRDQCSAAPEPEKPQFQELKSYPAEKLMRQLGAGKLSAILFRLERNNMPHIEESTTVTVELPWVPATVRLLEPLEHSTCSCRKKAFCDHKAEALLSWKLSKGLLDPELLRREKAAAVWDIKAVRAVCRTVREELSNQLAVGISRIPETVCEDTDRLASLCHTAKLADLERSLRSLHAEYERWSRRSAAFREWELLSRISRVCRLAKATEEADQAALPDLAGTFREEYSHIGDLRLYLLGLRDVTAMSGYGGIIYYFWDRKNREFYTFSDLRPDFYENNRRRSEVSPWDLPCTLRQAWNNCLDLSGAKVNDSGNLSSTRECRATLIGPAPPWSVIPAEEIVTDFDDLLPRSIGSERNRLVLVRPARWEQQEYDTVSQTFSLRLFDALGRDLWLEVNYTKAEEQVVRQLQHLAQYMTMQPVIFGSVCRDGDRLKIYPIECFESWEETP